MSNHPAYVAGAEAFRLGRSDRSTPDFELLWKRWGRMDGKDALTATNGRLDPIVRNSEDFCLDSPPPGGYWPARLWGEGYWDVSFAVYSARQEQA